MVLQLLPRLHTAYQEKYEFLTLICMTFKTSTLLSISISCSLPSLLLPASQSHLESPEHATWAPDFMPLIMFTFLEYSLPAEWLLLHLSTGFGSTMGEAPLSLPSPVDYCIYLVVFPVLLLLIFIISSSKYFQVFLESHDCVLLYLCILDT